MVPAKIAVVDAGMLVFMRGSLSLGHLLHLTAPNVASRWVKTI